MLLRKRTARLFSIAAALFFLTLIATACGGNSMAGSKEKSEALKGPEDAVAVYKQTCMQCHGAELKGRMGPETNLQKIGERLTKEDIVDTIKNGGPSRMPAIKTIDDADAEKVAAWLATLK
ncbi:c-type cytochrome [Paenibacillus marinisediminis]